MFLGTDMAVITAHRRKNKTQYTARIRIKRGGKMLVDASQTFAKKFLAKAWADKREAYYLIPISLARPLLVVSAFIFSRCSAGLTGRAGHIARL